MMNDLEKYFNNNSNKLITKWMHYFEIYDHHFTRFRNKKINILEIGIHQGGSIEMWKKYFGEKCTIYGVDINPHCKSFEEEKVKIIIGDQENIKFLATLTKSIPKIDILIDDGGHGMKQQINTFKTLFHHIKDDGLYLCEDLHTSYWPSYGGDYKQSNTFIEYSKNFIDYINAWHSKNPFLKITNFTKTVHSLHYYDSILVIEKKLIFKPNFKQTGIETIENYNIKKSHILKLLNSITKKIYRVYLLIRLFISKKL